MHPSAQWPCGEDTYRLAAELLAGRPTAPDEIADAFLVPLADHLRRWSRHEEPDLCDEAAGTAIMDTVSGKNRFDPARSNLGAFLRMAARRDLQNLLEKEARHKRPLIPLEFVAEAADRGNTPVDDDRPTLDDPRLVTERASFAPVERSVFELMLAGERTTAAFARAAGLTGESVEVEREVKRLKDRIKARLRRAVGGGR